MTTPHDGTELSVYADAGPGAALALPGPSEPGHDPAPSLWTDLVDAAMADPGTDLGPDDGDDLDAVLEGIVIPAPAAPPDQDVLPPPTVILGQAEKPAAMPAAPVTPPVPPTPPAPPPTPATPAGGSSGQVPPAAPPSAGPEPGQQPDGPEPEPADPPAWWTSSYRRDLADRAAWQLAGDHAAQAAARVAPLLDVPEAGPDQAAEKKATREERTKARDAAGIDRARRFRKWAALTVLSACIGAELRLPQALGAVISGAWDQGGQWAGTGAAGFLVGMSWSVDWYLRGGTREQGATRIGDIRRARIPILIVVRVPFASALLAGLGADGLLDAATLSIHQLFS